MKRPYIKAKVTKKENNSTVAEKLFTPMERIAFAGLLAKDVAITKEYIEPLKQELNFFLQEVGTRVGISLTELIALYDIGIDRLVPKTPKSPDSQKE